MNNGRTTLKASRSSYLVKGFAILHQNLNVRTNYLFNIQCFCQISVQKILQAVTLQFRPEQNNVKNIQVITELLNL